MGLLRVWSIVRNGPYKVHWIGQDGPGPARLLAGTCYWIGQDGPGPARLLPIGLAKTGRVRPASMPIGLAKTGQVRPVSMPTGRGGPVSIPEHATPGGAAGGLGADLNGLKYH